MQYMQNRTARKPTISLRVHPKLLAEVDDLVGRTRMKSRTEFLERAIEAYVQDIRDSKVVIVKSWTEPKARAAIVKYLRRHPSAFVSEICEALGIDFELGFRVVSRLMEDGIVDRTP
jgi:metal-responsive CopG/Arc/MetJ family transcriptional regulator